MKYLKIINKGELDIRIIALMGATTKSGSYDKIGHFGTGLKYTIAYLFRNNITFAIYPGSEFIKISTQTETIQNNDYDIICINNEKTSITTNMGADWKAWMIIRELWSNALDEGEAEYSITENVTGHEGYTTFYIELTPDILAVHNNWYDYFLGDAEPLYENDDFKIYPASGGLKLYKQGILIHQETKESLFNYDITNARINELREYGGYVESELVQIITQIDDPKTIQYFLEHVTEDHFEGSSIDYSYSWYNKTFNDVWKETLKGAKIIHKKAKDRLEARGIKVDTAANIVVPEALYKGLSKYFEGIGALRVSKAVNDFFEIYNEKLHDKTMQAKEILEKAGYYIEPELTFVYGVFGDKRVLAKIDADKKTIYISEKHIEKDLFSVCTMLIEENEHYKTGLTDETRDFQQHFIDLYTNSILEKASINLIDQKL